jgi:hypothetical protein
MPSMRAAINAKCRDCIVDDLEPGNWRQQVTACTSEDCALHPLRPMSESRPKSGPQSTEEAKP